MLPQLLEKAKNLKGVFRDYESIACVYIFGSQIKGFATRDSDIDFAILLKKEDDLEERGLLAYKIEKTLGFIAPVEVIILNHQRLIFKYNVIRDGKIVYEADRDCRVKFETEVMRQYFAFEPHLRFMEKYYVRGLLRRVSCENK